jgi:hypothetical protein
MNIVGIIKTKTMLPMTLKLEKPKFRATAVQSAGSALTQKDKGNIDAIQRPRATMADIPFLSFHEFRLITLIRERLYKYLCMSLSFPAQILIYYSIVI